MCDITVKQLLLFRFIHRKWRKDGRFRCSSERLLHTQTYGGLCRKPAYPFGHGCVEAACELRHLPAYVPVRKVNEVEINQNGQDREAERSESRVDLHGHFHSPEEKKRRLNRLNRVIGHLQHVRGMIEDDADCAEILVQIAAIRSALNGLGKQIINEHISHCIYHAIENGDKEAVEEFQKAVEKFL